MIEKINYFIPDKKNNVSLYIHTTRETYFHFELKAVEYRPNSGPEQSSPLQNATIIWQGPKYLIFDTKELRLKSYTHWPHDMKLSPDSLSAAGFYYTDIYKFITISHCITIRIFIFESIYDTLFTVQGDGTMCFHFDGGLKNWRPANDAWREHAHWFPYCVYIRYIKGEEFIRECRSCYLHSCNHTALTCFSETATPAGRAKASRHLPGTSSYNT